VLLRQHAPRYAAPQHGVEEPVQLQRGAHQRARLGLAQALRQGVEHRRVLVHQPPQEEAEGGVVGGGRDGRQLPQHLKGVVV
jgi:hypothetical protein